MKPESKSHREIVNEDKILEIMTTALAQKWGFRCLSMVNNQVNSQAARLTALDIEANAMMVDFSGLEPKQNSLGTYVFRIKRGGLSYSFKSRLLKSVDQNHTTDTPSTDASRYQFQIPDMIRFSQLRNSLRINLSDWRSISVSFFTDDAVQLQGTVVDISATGAKVRFAGNFSSQAGDSNLVAACQLLMPDESQILTQAKVLGAVYDEEQDISFVRCKYLGLNSGDASQLEKLIDDYVSQNDSPHLAIA